MTTVGPQVQNFDLPQFVFLQNKPKKTTNGNFNSFQSLPFHKTQGNHTKQYYPCPSTHPSQYRSPQNNRVSGAKKYNNFVQNDTKLENPFNFEDFANNFGKGSYVKSSPEKLSWSAYASTASDSDSNGSHISSELSGFKIIQSGKTVHDETEDDFLEPPTDFKGKRRADGDEDVKFAASLMTIGPSAKEISLPSFA